MDEHDDQVTNERALEIARTHLDGLGMSAQLEGREASVQRSRKGVIVVFDAPPGVRGGPFTVTVSDDGQIVSQRFER